MKKIISHLLDSLNNIRHLHAEILHLRSPAKKPFLTERLKKNDNISQGITYVEIDWNTHETSYQKQCKTHINLVKRVGFIHGARITLAGVIITLSLINTDSVRIIISM